MVHKGSKIVRVSFLAHSEIVNGKEAPADRPCQKLPLQGGARASMKAKIYVRRTIRLAFNTFSFAFFAFCKAAMSIS